MFKRIWRLAHHDTRPVPNLLVLNRSTVHGVQCTLLFFTAIHNPITQSHLTEIRSLKFNEHLWTQV